MGSEFCCKKNYGKGCEEGHNGYHMAGSACAAYEGSCNNGAMIAQSSRTQENHCETCGSGFGMTSTFSCETCSATDFQYSSENDNSPCADHVRCASGSGSNFDTLINSQAVAASCQACLVGTHSDVNDYGPCDACGDSEYQTEVGQYQCNACTAFCTAGFTETTACTASTDRVCTQNVCTCDQGTAATGAACIANGEHICASCDMGYFGTDESCIACTSCGAGFTETTACTASTDTVCTAAPMNNPTTAAVTYEFVANTKCKAADGKDFEQYYNSNFKLTRGKISDPDQCKEWCTETGSDCVAYGMGKRSDLTKACMIYMKKGTHPTEKFNARRFGIRCAHCGQNTAVGGVGQTVISKATDRNWECRKKVTTPAISTCDESTPGKHEDGYRGCQSKTVSGRTYQKWTSQKVHKHTRTPENVKFAGKGLGDHNNCRNPDNEPNGIWCYTTDKSKRWEYCDPVQTCDESTPGKHEDGYRGYQTKTVSGRTCQKWTSQKFHKHTRTPENVKFVGKGLGDHNNCRNPDNEPNGIWCYTTDK